MKIWIKSAVLVLVGALTTAPAFAGNLTLINGSSAWQSTNCAEPTPPPALASLDPEIRADDLNQRITLYNAYAQQMQTYMNCVSDEAQQDANAASETITGSAKTIIDQAQARLSELNVAATRRY